MLTSRLRRPVTPGDYTSQALFPRVSRNTPWSYQGLSQLVRQLYRELAVLVESKPLSQVPSSRPSTKIWNGPLWRDPYLCHYIIPFYTRKQEQSTELTVCVVKTTPE